MPRDIRNTPAQTAYFEALGDLHNPTAQLFADLFAAHKDSPPKYHVDDMIIIGSEQSPFVKENSSTTCGIYLFNKFILEPLKIFGYVNKPFGSKELGALEDGISDGLMQKDLTTEQVAEFIDRLQFLLGGPLAHLINPSINPDIMTLPPQAAALKKKLLAENKAGIEANDPQTSSKIEKEVTKVAMDWMNERNDPSLSFFKSGAIDPYNNYRTMFVMKGAVKDNTGESPTGYKIVTSEYDNGITKEDMPKIADTVVTSSYNSGVATQDSGYMGKKYNTILQRVKLLERGSDCKTPDTFQTVITNRHLYRYIMENGKPVCLTPEVIDKYKGKVCKLRSPLHCHAKDPYYCNICMGDRLYDIGVHNVGLTVSILSGATLNAALKTKHNVTVGTYTIKEEDILKYVN
jgi:hypothetical protein